MSQNSESGVASWVRRCRTPIHELELSAPLDDLEPVAAMVADARVVALGESAHHVREFHQVRHRLLRYLVERCGLTVYALEAPFTEGHVLDAWVQGGQGRVEDVAAAGIALSLGDSPEVHEALAWMRSYNQGGPAEPVRCVGADLPGSIGSPLPALNQVADYLRYADPESLSLLKRAVDVVEKFHDPSAFQVLGVYPTLPDPDRDALTSALSQLTARMERAATWQRGQGRGSEHAAASHHLRGAWLLDQLHRAALSEDFGVASTFRDVYLAESVLRLLDDASDRRVVLAAHNWHIQRTPAPGDSPADLLPAGFHLAAALGEKYRAIGLTSSRGTTAVASPDVDRPGEFTFRGAPLPPPEAGSIEAALPTDSAWSLADLRAASAVVDDAEEYQRMRMADYFLDVPVFSAYDAIAHVTETGGTAATIRPGAPA